MAPLGGIVKMRILETFGFCLRMCGVGRGVASILTMKKSQPKFTFTAVLELVRELRLQSQLAQRLRRHSAGRRGDANIFPLTGAQQNTTRKRSSTRIAMGVGGSPV